MKLKKIKNYRIINLSGPIKYFLFSKLLIFILGLFKKKFENVILISCDGLPFIKKNGVNIWFGGTSLIIPEKFKKYKNNFPMIRNFIAHEKNFINLYPCDLKKITFKKHFKIIYVGSLKLSKLIIALKIWKKYKKQILKNLSLIDNKNFWLKLKLKKTDKVHNIYIALKNLIRLYVIKEINKKFKNNLVIVGSDWTEYIKNSAATKQDINYIRGLYSGNICLDFGSRWGDNTLYPRSIEIIESGGLLLQSLKPDSNKTFGHLKNFSTFNSVEDLIKKIQTYKKNYNLLNSNYKKIYSYFSNDNLNYKTLTTIKNLSKK